MQTMPPHFLVYSFACIPEYGASERLVNEVSTGGICDVLSFNYKKSCPSIGIEFLILTPILHRIVRRQKWMVCCINFPTLALKGRGEGDEKGENVAALGSHYVMLEGPRNMPHPV